jgi:YcaO-like protein with predicted kinase domain
MWARLEPWLTDMGITRVGNITGLDVLGIPVWAVYRPMSRSLVVSLGKGLSDADAKVSAVMECAETYCSERITAPLIHGNVADLGGKYPLVALNSLPQVEEPAPLDSPIYWIEGRDIAARGASVWVPYEMVHTRFTPAARQYFPSFVATTRGLAAGATIVEATCHALLELIEGSSNAAAYEMPNEEWIPRQLDLSTVDDPACRVVLDALERAGIVAMVVDATTALDVASFMATIVDAQDDGWRVVPAARGMGCHPSRGIALLRALLEAVQSRMAQVSGAREDLSRVVYSRGQDPVVRDTIRSMAKQATRPFQDIRTREFKSAEDDLNWAIDMLALHRMPQIIVVHVSGDFPFPVVRVIVPWLRAEVLA